MDLEMDFVNEYRRVNYSIYLRDTSRLERLLNLRWYLRHKSVESYYSLPKEERPKYLNFAGV